MIRDLTMYRALKEASISTPNNTAIYYEGKKISFKKLLSLVDITASILYNDLAIRKDDTILLSQPNIPNVLILFYALNKIGAITNFVHPFTPFDQLMDIYHKTNCKYVFAFEQRVAKEVDKFKTIKDITFVTRIEDYLPFMKKMNYHFFMNNKIRKKLGNSKDFDGFKYFCQFKDNYSPVIENEDNLKVSILLNSGSTTGEPKTILHNDKAFNFLAEHALELLNCDKEFINNKGMLTILPSFHGFGLGMSMHSPLVNNFTNVMIPKFTVKKVNKAMKHYDVKVVCGVPTMYDTLVNDESFIKNKAIKNLYVCYSGGDILLESTKGKFNSIMKKYHSDCQLYEGYGLTEAIAVNTVNNSKYHKDGSIGKALSEVDVKIFKEDGTYATSNEIGEIGLKSELNMISYYNDEFITKNCFKDGYILTGDMGYLDEENYLFFKERKKRVVKVSGVLVFPREVEEFIYKSFSDVKQACAIPVKDEKLGHVLKLFISPKLDESYIDLIKEACRNYLIRWAVPKEIVFMDALPLTKLNKINYKKLEEDNE